MDDESSLPISFIDISKVDSADKSDEMILDTPEFIRRIPSLDIMRATTKQFKSGDATDRAINLIFKRLASNTFIGKSYTEVKQKTKGLSK